MAGRCGHVALHWAQVLSQGLGFRVPGVLVLHVVPAKLQDLHLHPRHQPQCPFSF